MLKSADASQMLTLLFSKTSFWEQVGSSLLQVEGCDAHHQRQLASSGSAVVRLVYVNLGQLDQPLNESMYIGMGLQPFHFSFYTLQSGVCSQL